MQSPDHESSESVNRPVSSHIPSVSGVPRLVGAVPLVRNVFPPLIRSAVPPIYRPAMPLHRGVSRLAGGLSPLSDSSMSLSTYGSGSVALPLEYVPSVLSPSISHTAEVIELAGDLVGDTKISVEIATSEDAIEQIKGSVKQLEAVASLLEKLANLRKKLRPYQATDPAETWASRWITAPIIYLFSELRREELLGDLYETNCQMLLKNYPRWVVNVNNIVRAIELIESALRIKVQEWLSLLKQIK
jgi:hypothetical protein